MDLAIAGMQLLPGTILDGEGIVYRNGRIDFGAAQSRANSSPARARLLAAEHPAHYAVFDILSHPRPRRHPRLVVRAPPGRPGGSPCRDRDRAADPGGAHDGGQLLGPGLLRRAAATGRGGPGREGGFLGLRRRVQAVEEGPPRRNDRRRGDRLHGVGCAAAALGRAAPRRPYSAFTACDGRPGGAGGAAPGGRRTDPPRRNRRRGGPSSGGGRRPGRSTGGDDAARRGDRHSGALAPVGGGVRR